MTTLYDITFPPLINALKSAQNLVAQAEAHAAEKGTPITELFEARLAPDMWPLSQQIVITALHSAMTVAKLTGATPNKIEFGPGKSSPIVPILYRQPPSTFCPSHKGRGATSYDGGSSTSSYCNVHVPVYVFILRGYPRSFDTFPY